MGCLNSQLWGTTGCARAGRWCVRGGLEGGGGGRKQKDDGGGRFCSLWKHSQVHSHESTASGDGAIERRVPFQQLANGTTP